MGQCPGREQTVHLKWIIWKVLRDYLQSSGQNLRTGIGRVVIIPRPEGTGEKGSYGNWSSRRLRHTQNYSTSKWKELRSEPRFASSFIPDVLGIQNIPLNLLTSISCSWGVGSLKWMINRNYWWTDASSEPIALLQTLAHSACPGIVPQEGQGTKKWSWANLSASLSVVSSGKTEWRAACPKHNEKLEFPQSGI